MPIVVEVSAMDFADGAQRFNWCNCHTPDEKAAGLSGIHLGQGMHLGQLYNPLSNLSNDAPIYDATDGSGLIPPELSAAVSVMDIQPMPVAPVTSTVVAMPQTDWLLWGGGAAAAIAAYWWYTHKGRRR
jgi:hypothetical protein